MWRSQPLYSKGIICGANQAQEWLLPWWWERLRDHNDYPVIFCNFGMSDRAKEWCQERGEVMDIAFDPAVVKAKEAIDPKWVSEWEHCYTSTVWDFRAVWFQKPFALLTTLFQKTVWLDLDCEVLQSLEPLFELCNPDVQMGIMREFNLNHLPRFDSRALYNSGVIVYEYGASLVEQWAEGVLTLTDQFWGDEVLLSHLINTLRIPVIEIPEVFNWRVSQGINMNAVICHWIGGGGKTFIRQFGGFKPSLRLFMHPQTENNKNKIYI